MARIKESKNCAVYSRGWGTELQEKENVDNGYQESLNVIGDQGQDVH